MPITITASELKKVGACATGLWYFRSAYNVEDFTGVRLDADTIATAIKRELDVFWFVETVMIPQAYDETRKLMGPARELIEALADDIYKSPATPDSLKSVVNEATLCINHSDGERRINALSTNYLPEGIEYGHDCGVGHLICAISELWVSDPMMVISHVIDGAHEFWSELDGVEFPATAARMAALADSYAEQVEENLVIDYSEGDE